MFRRGNSTAPEIYEWAVDDDSAEVLFLRRAIRHSRLKTIGDGVFGVAAPRIWNDLHDLSLSLSLSLSLYQPSKTLGRHLFRQSFNI